MIFEKGAPCFAFSLGYELTHWPNLIILYYWTPLNVYDHRRSINTEEKAKVLAADFGDRIYLILSRVSYFAQGRY